MLSKNFIVAGHAIFTVSSTTEHYTYKIESPDKKKYYIRILTGKDNTKDYTYLGMMCPKTLKCFPTRASKYKLESKAFEVLNWAMKHIFHNREVPEGYKIQHEGKCGKCGRRLTDPVSIETGLGPVCRTEKGIQK